MIEEAICIPLIAEFFVPIPTGRRKKTFKRKPEVTYSSMVIKNFPSKHLNNCGNFEGNYFFVDGLRDGCVHFRLLFQWLADDWRDLIFFLCFFLLTVALPFFHNPMKIISAYSLWYAVHFPLTVALFQFGWPTNAFEVSHVERARFQALHTHTNTHTN